MSEKCHYIGYFSKLCKNQSWFIQYFTSRKRNIDVIILIKAVFNKDDNYFYNVFLEKASYELPKNIFLVWNINAVLW